MQFTLKHDLFTILATSNDVASNWRVSVYKRQTTDK